MADDQRSLLISWLNDAYAMEHSLMQVLENHVKDAKDHPELQAGLQEHLVQARTQAERVKGCIERLGGSTSALKTGMANVMGTLQGMSTGAAKDELVKNALADYAAEHFEVASYTALVAAATQVGDHETARICGEILQEEQEMADWLSRQVPHLVQEMLLRVTAKLGG